MDEPVGVVLLTIMALKFAANAPNWARFPA